MRTSHALATPERKPVLRVATTPQREDRVRELKQRRSLARSGASHLGGTHHCAIPGANPNQLLDGASRERSVATQAPAMAEKHSWRYFARTVVCIASTRMFMGWEHHSQRTEN